MKKRLFKLRALICMCAALGWWGLLYPELLLTPDTVNVYEEESGETADTFSEWSFGSDTYRQLLNGRNKITFRSKLLDNLNLFWEAFQNGN